MVSESYPWSKNTRIQEYKDFEEYFKQKQDLVEGSIEEIQEKCSYYQCLLDGCLQYEVDKRWDCDKLLNQVDKLLKK